MDIEYLASFKAEVKMKWLTGPHNVLYGAQIPQRDLLWPQLSNLLAPLSLCCWALQKYIKQGMCPNWRQVIPHNWTLLQLVLVPLGQSCFLRTLEVFSTWSPLTHFSAPLHALEEELLSLVSIIFWWMSYLLPSHHASTITAKYCNDLIPHLKPTPLLHPA